MVSEAVWRLRPQVGRALASWLRSVGWLVLFALLASCARQVAVTPSVSGPVTIPASDALRGTPAEVLLERAEEAQALGHWKAASLNLERAIRLAPASSWLYREMARLRLREGDARAAEGFARHALRNAPAEAARYRASLWRLLAICLANQGEQQAANQARQKANELW